MAIHIGLYSKGVKPIPPFLSLVGSQSCRFIALSGSWRRRFRSQWHWYGRCLWQYCGRWKGRCRCVSSGGFAGERGPAVWEPLLSTCNSQSTKSRTKGQFIIGASFRRRLKATSMFVLYWNVFGNFRTIGFVQRAASCWGALRWCYRGSGIVVWAGGITLIISLPARTKVKNLITTASIILIFV